jgi:hypothetical protein
MTARTSLAAGLLALATLALGPAPARAAPPPARAAAPLPDDGFSLGGWVGYEGGKLDGVQVRLDGVLPVRRFAPTISLAVVGSVGYGNLAGTQANGVELTAEVVKLVPALRLTVVLNDRFAVAGEVGVGWFLVDGWQDVPGAGPGDGPWGEDALMLRLGAAGFYALGPRVLLGLALVADPMYGEYGDTTLSLLAGAAYRF